MGRVRIAAALVGLVLLTSACGWTQAGYDAGRSQNNSLERTIGVSNVGRLTPDWATGEGFSGAPVAFGGSVFAQDSTHVHALSATTGHALWSAPLTPATDKTAVQPVGVAFARLDDGRSFVISADRAVTTIGDMPNGPRDIGGMLAAYDATTGAPVWSQQIGPHSAPLIVGSTVFVTSYQQGFRRVDLRRARRTRHFVTGAIKFRAKLDAVVDSLAAVGNQLIVVPTGFGFQAVAAGGCGAAMCPVAWAGVGGGRIPATSRRQTARSTPPPIVGSRRMTRRVAARRVRTDVAGALGDFSDLAVGHGLVFVGGSLNSLIPATLQAFRSDGCGSSTCSAGLGLFGVCRLHPALRGQRRLLRGHDRRRAARLAGGRAAEPRRARRSSRRPRRTQ